MQERSGFPADPCLKCTLCDVYCPVRKATFRFPGPKYVGPGLARLPEKSRLLDHTAGWCTGCQVCERVCPSGVKPAHLVLRARGRLVEQKGPTPRDWLLSHPDWLARAAAPVSPVVNWLLRAPVTVALLGAIAGIARRPLPAYGGRSYRSVFHRRPARGAAGGETERKVVLYVGCYARYHRPEIAWATGAILERNGVRVAIPPQVCCGVPALTNGLVKTVRKYARFNLRVLGAYVGRGYDVVTPCPSCGLSLKQEYREFFPSAEADLVAAHTCDAGEYLMSLYSEGQLGTSFNTVSREVAYHAPCHLRAQGVPAGFSDLLRMVPGVKIDILPEHCCGLSGTYGFKKEKYELSLAIGRELFQAVRSTGKGTVITECGPCQVQIQHGTGVDALHPAIVLAEAYGLWPLPEQHPGSDAVKGGEQFAE